MFADGVEQCLTATETNPRAQSGVTVPQEAAENEEERLWR